MITKNYVHAETVCEPNGMFSIKITYGEGKSEIYKSLTGDTVSLSRFVNLINEGEVSPLHIDDLIEDFLP